MRLRQDWVPSLTNGRQFEWEMNWILMKVSVKWAAGCSGIDDATDDDNAFRDVVFAIFGQLT